MGNKTTRIIEKPLPRNEEGVVDKQFLRDSAQQMLANIEFALGRKDAAKEIIKKELPTITTPEVRHAMIRAQGSFLTDENKIDEAQSLLEKLLAEETDHMGKAKTLLVLARNSLLGKKEGHTTQATQYLEQALEQESEQITQAQAYRMLANAYLEQKEYEKATQNIQKTMELAQLCGQKLEHARATMTLGKILREQARYKDATEPYRNAAEEFRKLGTLDDFAGTMYGLALCHSKQGEVEEAIAIYEETLEIVRPQLPKGKRGLVNDLLKEYSKLLMDINPEKAKQLAIEGRQYATEIYGTEHPTTQEYEQLLRNSETRILSAKIKEKIK